MFATNKNIQINDFGNICRTCLQNIHLKPIHDYVLIEILHKIADITYVQNDGFPQQICDNCCRRIYEIKAFAVQCKEIDFLLKKCIVDSKTSLEVQDHELEDTFHLVQNIPIEPIVIKEEPKDADEAKLDLVSSYKDHKHFLAMETEESSSNDDFNQQFIAKVNYHRNLLKTTTDAQHNPTSSNFGTSETSDEDRPTSSMSNQEDKSILKQMLKEKHKKQQETQPTQETSDLTYECGLCLKQFYQLNQFISHQSEHSDRSSNKCDLRAKECGDFKNIIKNVQDHKKVTVDGDEKYECPICFKTFKDSAYLIRHGRVHGNRPYKCDQCDKAYIESGHLVVHKRTHTGERPFVCETCSKAFVSLSNLVKHRVVHTGLRKIFTCDICGKEMNDPSNLRKHRRVHTKEKPFKCKYCATAFSGASDLRAHERLHTGERPYACDMCGKKFSRSTYLKKHKKACAHLLLAQIKNENETMATPEQEVHKTETEGQVVVESTSQPPPLKMESVE